MGGTGVYLTMKNVFFVAIELQVNICQIQTMYKTNLRLGKNKNMQRGGIFCLSLHIKRGGKKNVNCCYKRFCIIFHRLFLLARPKT